MESFNRVAAAGLAVACAVAPLEAQELLLPGGPYEAGAVPADARGSWLALLAGGEADRLAAVRVSLESVTEACTDSPGAARLVRVQGTDVALALLRDVPGLRAGVVPHGELAAPSDWRQPQAGSFASRPFALREERVGEGFRLRYTWGDAVETVFETEYEDEGHWNLLWLGDLNRDGWPDLLLQADGKYSRQTTRLLLSRFHAGGAALEEIAAFAISAC
jgi:hypothetical protein